MTRKFLIITFTLISIYSCQDADINESSKRNENWVYWIDKKTGEASWIPVTGNETALKNGRYTSFYTNGAIYQKGKLKNGKHIDTIYIYDLKEKLIKYELVKPDTLINYYIQDGSYTSYFQNCKIFEKGKIKNHEIGDEWTKYFENGNIDWTKKLVDGTGLKRWYYDNGQISNINYNVKGRTNGQVKSWFKNGQLKEISNWKNDEQNGKSETFFENGKPKEKANWINNKLDGKLENWYENGQKEQVEFYNNGVRNGQILQWYSNGNKKAIIKFISGEVDGRVINYYENGKVKSQGDFKDGKHNGLFIWYDENGKVTKKLRYLNGQLVTNEK
jgi:antitoxin component YwqK of YwqJK toxin-antitoxin module